MHTVLEVLEQIQNHLRHISVSLEIATLRLVIGTLPSADTVTTPKRKASETATPLARAKQQERDQELIKMKARSAQLLEKLAELEQRRLSIARRIARMDRRRALHDLSHLVDEDLAERRRILNARGESSSDAEDDYLENQVAAVWGLTHLPMPTAADADAHTGNNA